MFGFDRDFIVGHRSLNRPSQVKLLCVLCLLIENGNVCPGFFHRLSHVPVLEFSMFMLIVI